MNRRRSGFTLVELVVVIMILGILAAVAAPRLLNTAGSATDNGLRQSLSVIRDAIELHAAQNGGQLPGDAGTQADFLADIQPFIRGTFPDCPVAPNQNANITFSAADPLIGVAADGTGWKYNNTTGEFICNNENPTQSDPTVNYDQL